MKRSTTELKTRESLSSIQINLPLCKNEHGHLGRWPVQFGIASDSKLSVLKPLLDEVSEGGEAVETGICHAQRLQEDAFYRTKDVR